MSAADYYIDVSLIPCCFCIICIILSVFQQKCHKSEEIWAGGDSTSTHIPLAPTLNAPNIP